LKRIKGKKWEPEELELLRKNWPDVLDDRDLIHLFVDRNEKAIKAKSYQIGLVKTDRVKEIQLDNKRKMLYERNTRGRKMSLEFALYEIKKFKTKKELRIKDGPLYTWIIQSDYCDEIMSNFSYQENFNYPQTFLFECCKIFYPGELIRYNDRRAIHPRELDIYIPERKIAFEYDGKNWHDEAEDAIKDAFCLEKNIKLYRIKEINKNKVPETVLSQLSNFGFDVSKINVQEINDVCFSTKFDEDSLRNIASQYTSYSLFIKEHQREHLWILKLGKTEFYSHMADRRTSVTKEELISFLKSCSTKKEVIANMRMFNAYYRNFRTEEIMKIYENLEDTSTWKTRDKQKPYQKKNSIHETN
jgi:hypothetical protein